MNAFSRVFPAILIASASGCVSKTSGIIERETVWSPGTSTRREIVAHWGNPDKIEIDVWIWKESRLIGGKVKAAYMMVGMTVSNTRLSSREHRLSFDAKGILTAEEISDSVPGGVSWSLWPF